MRKIMLLALGLTFFVPALGPAQSLADRVPGDSVIYIGWHGVDGNIPGYDHSHLKAMVDASQFSQLIHESIPQMVQKLTGDDPDTKEIADLSMDIESTLWKHPTVIFLEGIDATPPIPKAAILCQAGADSAAIADKIGGLFRKLGAPDLIHVKSAGDLLVISTYDVVEHPENPLSANKEFQADFASLGKNPFTTMYVDGAALNSNIEIAVHLAGDADIQRVWPKIRAALGLQSFKSMAWTSGFDGPDWSDQALVDAPAPRQGLMAMGSDPVTSSFMKLIPQSAVTAGAGTLSLDGLIPGAISIARQIDPDAATQMQQGVDMVNQMLGIDMQNDLFSLLGKEWAYYIDPEANGQGGLGAVIINRPTDPAKLAASITKVEGFLNGMLTAQLAPQKMTVEMRQFDAAGTTVHYMATPLLSPAWAIKDGTLYLGFAPQSVVGAIGKKSDGKSILDNPAFQGLQKQLAGPAQITGFVFLDLPKTIPLGYQDWVFSSRLYLGLGDLFGLHSPPMIIPPLEKIMAETHASGSVSWVDDAGFHMKSITPFPGSEMLGAGGSVSPSTMMQLSAMMGVIGPWMQNMRMERAEVVPAPGGAVNPADANTSPAHLKQIAIACLLYTNDNVGKLPPDLGKLATSEDVVPTVFFRPENAGNLPPNWQSGIKPDELAKWVNDNSDYVLAHAGKSIQKLPPMSVLAYEKAPVDGFRNIAFVDGHVETFPADRAEQIIKAGKE